MEDIIIKLLFENKEYYGRVHPFLDINYFEDYSYKKIIEIMITWSSQYKNHPTYNQIKMVIGNTKEMDDNLVDTLIKKLEYIEAQKKEEYDINYIIDETEHYFQEQMLSKAILKGAEILQSDEKKHLKHSLPELMREALKLSFKNTVGMIYGTDDTIDKQYYFYHHKDKKFMLPTFTSFNNITRGGFCKKTINVFQAGTGVGKTTVLCNMAKELLMSGNNVLYISMEISENSLIERLDANLLDWKTSELPTMAIDNYSQKIKEIQKKTAGKLVVKEYPTCSGNVNLFRSLMDELETKEGFKVDFIVVDYLNICGSIRYKNIGDTYGYVKAIIEELRGLCVERNIGCLTATQVQRSAWNASDMELNQVAESSGTANTADLVVGIIETDELKDKGQYLFKVLKSRYAPITSKTKKFLMGVDKEKQKIFELSNPLEGLIDDDVSDVSSGVTPPIKPAVVLSPVNKINSSWDEWSL